jgi:hypothetical protein
MGKPSSGVAARNRRHISVSPERIDGGGNRMVDDLLSFGPFLSLSQEDPTLIEMVEGLGAKFRVKATRELGFLTVKKAGVEFRFQKES